MELAENPDRQVAARQTLITVLRALMLTAHEATIATAWTAVQNAPTDGPATFEVICADAFLHTGAVELATLVRLLHQNNNLGVQVANHIGTRSHHINQRLDEHEMAVLLSWLETLPRQARDPRRRAWVVRDANGVGEWRDQTLRDLTNRRTVEALEQLNALHAQFPERLDLTAAVLTARTAVHASLWKAPTPNDIAKLMADTSSRLLRTNRELADLLTETLDRIALDLPTHGELLWDRQRQRPPADTQPKQRHTRRYAGTWRPKLEAAFCAYIAHELKIRLQGRGFAINREVLVQPTDPYGAGERTDILVEATSTRDRRLGGVNESADRLAVVIEVKGQWNPRLEDDLSEQLAGRYLPEVQTDTGIYLVGWFPVEQWNDCTDSNRRRAKKRDLENTKTLLYERAIQLTGQHVTVHFMSAPRPSKDGEQSAP